MAKEDARIIKTKNALFNAAIHLLREKTYEDITVNELCEKAGVRRATFYKHYVDKYDFSASMIESFVRSFDEKMKMTRYRNFPVEYHVVYAKELLNYFLDSEELVKLIFKSNMCSVLINVIIDQHCKVLTERLRRSVEYGTKLVASVETTAIMLAGGIGTIITKWFEKGKPTSEEELFDNIEKLVLAMFK